MNNTQPCPCQSGLSYEACCAPLHQGAAAASPAALMRSRYSAFALGQRDYLLASWHPDNRPTSLTLEPQQQWCSLAVLSSNTQADQGQVHFRAICKDPQGFTQLEEQARFVRQQGHWFYLDGDSRFTPLKPGRNDPCPCGSGGKFKKCCG